MKSTTKLKTLLIAFGMVFSGIGLALAPTAAPVYADATSEISRGAAATGGSGDVNTLPTKVKGIINVILYIVGILAVVMIIFGGIKYMTSAGDQSAVTSAKNTILYGIIGLVITLLAYAIVQFVIGKVAA